MKKRRNEGTKEGRNEGMKERRNKLMNESELVIESERIRDI